MGADTWHSSALKSHNLKRKINRYPTWFAAKYNPITNYSFEISTASRLCVIMRTVVAHNIRRWYVKSSYSSLLDKSLNDRSLDSAYSSKLIPPQWFQWPQGAPGHSVQMYRKHGSSTSMLCTPLRRDFSVGPSTLWRQAFRKQWENILLSSAPDVRKSTASFEGSCPGNNSVKYGALVEWHQLGNTGTLRATLSALRSYGQAPDRIRVSAATGQRLTAWPSTEL
jgi:hypothetical protein